MEGTKSKKRINRKFINDYFSSKIKAVFAGTFHSDFVKSTFTDDKTSTPFTNPIY
jgi:hypothetical protein